MADKEFIQQRLYQHYKKVVEYGITKEQIIGLYLYGSQNYLVDLEDSDIDSKCIIVPTLLEAVCKKPIIKTLELDNGEHCEIIDIRLFFDNIKKQNVNFVEILFTQYCVPINRTLFDLFEKFFISKNEELARYNVYYGVHSIVGQALHTLHENPTNPKKVANSYRLLKFVEKYKEGVPYKCCLVGLEEDNNLIKRLKSKKVLSESESELSLDLTIKLSNIVNEYKNDDSNKEYRYSLDTYIDNCIVKMITTLQGET